MERSRLESFFLCSRRPADAIMFGIYRTPTHCAKQAGQETPGITNEPSITEADSSGYAGVFCTIFQ